MRKLATLTALLASVLGTFGMFTGEALATSGSWSAEATAPTYFRPGTESGFTITAKDSSPSGEITINDTLPPGVQVKLVQLGWSGFAFGIHFDLNPYFHFCAVSGQNITCHMAVPYPAPYTGYSTPQIGPEQAVRVFVGLNVPTAMPEGSLTNQVTVEGGGLTSATIATPIAVSAHPRFGVSSLTMEPIETTRLEHIEGAYDLFEVVNEPYKQPFTQAGSHPWGLTTRFTLATEAKERHIRVPGELYELPLRPTQDPKDIVGELPPGLLGDPMAVPRCSLAVATSHFQRCPADTQVGVYRWRIEGNNEDLGPIVNVVPEAGQSAEFALETTAQGFITPLLTAHVIRTHEVVEGRVREGYGFDVASHATPQREVSEVELTFWGVPADISHDPMRGRFCAQQEIGAKEGMTCNGTGNEASNQPAVPFVSTPTTCTAGPETFTLLADSWQEPVVEQSNVKFKEHSVPFPAVTGCNSLQFNAGTGVTAEPDTKTADQPVGLDVGLKIPLNESPTTNTTPELRKTQITLPEGMSVSPDVVDGIHACNAEGPEGINITGPEAEEVSELTHEKQLAPGKCPDASTVGTAEAVTPFLPNPVKGHVYLARPGCGGPGERACTEEDVRDGNLYRLYLELGGTGAFANTGIQFKVPLETEVNPATGQITSVSSELLQALYSEVRIHLNGGPRAPLSNSAVCGTTLTTADFTPWSAPGIVESGPDAGLAVAGTPDLQSSQPYEVTGCTSPTPFKPGFVAGTVSAQAGQFSPFTMNLSRNDGEQYVKGIQVHTPSGLLGVLASVPLCEEAQADAGTCSEASKIGTTRVATGAGSHPFEVEGNVYLTGPYSGSPFGLSIVVHLDVGPFHLGVKVVRARIAVDPTTSELTVTTDETGPYAVPQIVFGVPVRMKRVTVNIDRPGFMFNPTNCNQLQIMATISGSQDASWSASSPFAVAGCRSLAFKPHFTASTNGHTSRKLGASLDVKLFYPKGAIGNDANVAYVKVDLPKQLPSRLTTLQQACTAATFAANPGNCPKGSIVGIVRAHTPLLPVELTGPVYFVSHGGEAFPSLVIVLQGDGVRVDLTGTTFINKANITSSTFKTVPDVPVETFELYLPQGGDSALAANGSLCKARSKLKMPTLFVAQNGARFKQTTKIGVTGCGRSGKAARAHGRQSRHGNGRAGR